MTAEDNHQRSDMAWHAPNADLPLPTGEVHVWRIALVPTDVGQLAREADCLAEDERTRAARFLFDQHRNRFRMGRAALRRILARYLQCPAEQLRFEYSGLGKPSLRNNVGPVGREAAGRATTVSPAPLARDLSLAAGTQLSRQSLHFNFSNSANWALLAITTVGEIGVDLECVRTMSDMPGLAERFFAAEEVQAILSPTDSDERCQRFFRCWTRKEAFLKAVGKGLTFPLEKVCVTARPDEPPKIVAIDGDPHAAAAWQLHHLDPLPGYLGAVAFQGAPVPLRLFAYQPAT